MKKLTLVYLIALSFTIIWTVGCTKKHAIDEETFTKIMSEEIFSIQDTTEKNNSPFIIQSFTAENENFTVEFMITSNDQYAIQIYNQIKNNFESKKGTVSAQSSLSLKNRASFRLNTGGIYYLVSRIDNTLIFVITESKNKENVDDIIKKIGY